jgi:hypothetical protein
MQSDISSLSAETVAAVTSNKEFQAKVKNHSQHTNWSSSTSKEKFLVRAVEATTI